MINQPIIGVVLSVDGPEEGRSDERTYTIAWNMPTGARQTVSGVGARQVSANDELERRAFGVGFTVFGLLLEGGTNPKILMLDREDYAVGCADV